MLDSIRITTADEQTALALAYYFLARFHPELVEEQGGWEVRLETESEDDLPDLLSILYDRLQAPAARSRRSSTASRTRRASVPETSSPRALPPRPPRGRRPAEPPSTAGGWPRAATVRATAVRAEQAAEGETVARKGKRKSKSFQPKSTPIDAIIQARQARRDPAQGSSEQCA